MSDSVAIKKVYNDEIRLSEITLNITTWKTIIVIWVIPTLVMFALLYSMKMYEDPESLSENMGAVYLCSIAFGIITLIFGYGSDICKDKCPGYAVYISNSKNYEDSIHIISKTPEGDQIEICKASKVLERRLKDEENKKERIRRLAENCK